MAGQRPDLMLGDDPGRPTIRLNVGGPAYYAADGSVFLADRPYRPPSIVINEVLPSGNSWLADEFGEHDAWIELYNAASEPVDLSGMLLSNSRQSGGWALPQGTRLPPRGHILIWADSQPQQGPLHSSFRLGGAGDELFLLDSPVRRRAVVDWIELPDIEPQLTYGRLPDGYGDWFSLSRATPGATNHEPPPAITNVRYEPRYPSASESVTVTATISDNMAIGQVVLYADTGRGYTAAFMQAEVADGGPASGTYTGHIGGQPQGSSVAFFVEARDEAGAMARAPATAPAQIHGYTVGRGHPPVVINELMLSSDGSSWVELFNPGAVAVDLSGMYLSTHTGEARRWRLPDGATLARSGHYLMRSQTGGPGLDQSVIMVGLYGNQVQASGPIDMLVFEPLPHDVSLGRSSDGVTQWRYFRAPTPGLPNDRSILYLPFAASGSENNPQPPLFVIGYTDGQSVGAPGVSIAGTRDPGLYQRARVGWSTYRFDLPAGTYSVRLHFAEITAHAAGQRLFDVWVAGRPVLLQFDPYAVAGDRQYAMVYTFDVTVPDYGLEVRAVPVVGQPILSAIEVMPSAPPRSPQAVTGLGAVDSYGAAILSWQRESGPVSGYHILRSDSPDGPWLPTGGFTPITRLIDQPLVPGRTYHYRVQSVGPDGSLGPPSEAVSVQPRDTSHSQLPVYAITLDQQHLDQLYRQRHSNDEVPAVFTSGTQSLTAKVRFRGSISREWGKKSWKVKFTQGGTLGGRRQLNLHAGFLDPSLARQKLAYDAYRQAGVAAPEARLVHLQVNGRFAGVFTEVEQVDDTFLSRRSLPLGALYKCYGELRPLDSYDEYQQVYEKQTLRDRPYYDLIDLIRGLDGQFVGGLRAFLQSEVDVDSVLDYYAVGALIAARDNVYQNYYLYRNPLTNKWQIVPWDTDTTFGRASAPIYHGSRLAPDPRRRFNRLFDALIQVPEYRTAYHLRIEALRSTLLEPGHLWPQIDALKAELLADGLRDPYKFDRENNQAFLDSFDALRAYAVDRLQYLQGARQ
jgi:spore coat protein H